MKARGNRDQLVLATKYTIGYKGLDQVKLKVPICAAILRFAGLKEYTDDNRTC